jgi:hypothetical protein
MTKSKGILKPRKQWSDLEIGLIIALYPCTQSKSLASLFKCSISQIYNKAESLKLHKSQWFKDSPMASRLRQGGDIGKAYRYPKGHIPKNKGIKGLPSHPNQMKTQFKTGEKPINWRPIGSIRVDREGYVLIKMAEGKFKWKFLHRIIWQRLNGPIPSDYVLTFIDSNKQNCKITNLSLITKKQNAINNSVHRFGPELAEIYRLKGLVTRHINRREENEPRHRSA